MICPKRHTSKKMAVQGGPERCYSVRNESPLMLRYLAILLGATLFLVSPSAPTTAQQTDFDAI
jgi:hypothetical protein